MDHVHVGATLHGWSKDSSFRRILQQSDGVSLSSSSSFIKMIEAESRGLVVAGLWWVQSYLVGAEESRDGRFFPLYGQANMTDDSRMRCDDGDL